MHKSQVTDICILNKFLKKTLLSVKFKLNLMLACKKREVKKVPYPTIVGSGINSAILHAHPSHKKLLNGKMVLIDAGTEISSYCIDVTRVFPVNGKFSSQQQASYELVLNTQTAAIDFARAGIEWREVHKKSARPIANGLKDLNIVQGEIDSVLESGAISVFYPHGVGHLVGLRVRDTGFNERDKVNHYYGVSLRVDMKIEENMMLTVEPGCYFIPALLQNKSLQEKYRAFINWSEVEKWKDIGGVRIEGDILITQGSPEVFTSIIQK